MKIKALCLRVQRYAKKAGKTLYYRASYYAPSLRRFSEEEKAYYAERDPKENAETTPEEGDGAELIAIWAVEFYSPSQYTSLVRAMRKLGWDRDDAFESGRNPVAWLENVRLSSHARGSTSLGILRRSSERPRLMHDQRPAPLPSFCQYATGQIVQVTPSLCAVVLGFVVAPERRRGLEAILRTQYVTKIVPRRRGYSIPSPRNQKDDAIEAMRTGLRRQIVDWFADNLPGSLSSRRENSFLPTWEVLVLDRAAPFAGGRASALLDGLDIVSDHHVWSSKRHPGLKFSSDRFRQWRSRTPDTQWIMALSKSDISQIDLKTYGGESAESLFAYLHLAYDDLIVAASAPLVLAHHDRLTSEIRDAIEGQGGNAGAERLLRKFRVHAKASVDVAAVAPDLADEAANDRGYFHRHVPDFELKLHNGERLDLASELRRIISLRATRLASFDRIVRELLAQQAMMVSAHEGYGIQRLAMFVAVLALFVALASLFVTVPSALWENAGHLLMDLLQPA